MKYMFIDLEKCIYTETVFNTLHIGIKHKY